MSSAVRSGLLAAAVVTAGSRAVRVAATRNESTRNESRRIGSAWIGSACIASASNGPAWTRTNYRGVPVSLCAGPLVAAAAVAGAPSAAATVAAVGAVAAGRYDDVVGARPEQRRDKGFRGHLAALRAGRLSAGAVKLIGIGAAALTAAGVQTRRDPARAGSPAEILLNASLLAGTANLVNLLDLRPGRAAKTVGLLTALGAGTAASSDRRPFVALLGASAAVLPDDLAERSMLGDAGANGLGIVLGLAVTQAAPLPLRLGLLAGVLALTAASERVSFTAVIDRTPPLAWLDGLGRRG